MVPQGARVRAAPQNRPSTAHQRPPLSGQPRAGQHYAPPSAQPQHFPPPSSQPYRPIYEEGEDDDFPESQMPMSQGYNPPMPNPSHNQNYGNPSNHGPMGYPSPSTPAPGRGRRPFDYPGDTPQRQRTETPMGTPQQAPIRRQGEPGQPGAGGKVTASHLLAFLKQMDAKIDALAAENAQLVADNRAIRDSVHDISNAVQVLPSREEINDDMKEHQREYFGPAFHQMKSDIIDYFKNIKDFKEIMRDFTKEIKRDMGDRMRSLAEEVVRSSANLPRQVAMTDGSPDKTNAALVDHLVTSLRSVDELKTALQPLNLPQMFQMMFHVGQSLGGLHAKLDQILGHTQSIPAAQVNNLAVLQRHVDAHSTSQEQSSKDSLEASKKVENNLNILQEGLVANGEAVAAVHKMLEEYNEANREAKRLVDERRRSSIEQGVQTTPRPTYVNSLVETEKPNPSTSSPAEVEALLSSTVNGGPGPSSVLDGFAGFALGVTTAATPVPERAPAKKAAKKPIKRRATKKAAGTPAGDEMPEASSSTDVPAAASTPGAALPPTKTPHDVFGPVTQPQDAITSSNPRPPTITYGSRGKRRKLTDISETTTQAQETRRSSRERKSPERFGHSLTPENETNANVLVPDTKPAPTAARKLKSPHKASSSPTKAAPKLATTASGAIINLADDSLNSIESVDAMPIQPAAILSSQTANSIESVDAIPIQPAAILSSQTAISSQITTVPETVLGSGSGQANPKATRPGSGLPEPPHIIRSATQHLRPSDRQAMFAPVQESIEMADVLRFDIEEHNDNTLVADEDERDPADLSGSQILGFESL